MKAKIVLLMIFLSGVTLTKAQDTNYYWVVESNMNIKDQSTVKIYDERNALVHEVRLGSRIDVTKRKTRKALHQIIKRYTIREASNGKKTRFKSSV